MGSGQGRPPLVEESHEASAEPRVSARCCSSSGVGGSDNDGSRSSCGARSGTSTSTGASTGASTSCSAERQQVDQKAEVCLVVTYEDGSQRRHALSVVKAFHTLPLHAFLSQHGLSCWRSEALIGRGSYGQVYRGRFLLPDGSTHAAAAKLFLSGGGGPAKAREHLQKELRVPLQLQLQRQEAASASRGCSSSSCAASASSSGSAASPDSSTSTAAAEQQPPQLQQGSGDSGLFVRVLAHGGRPGQLPLMVMELADGGCVFDLLEAADRRRWKAWDDMTAAAQPQGQQQQQQQQQCPTEKTAVAGTDAPTGCTATRARKAPPPPGFAAAAPSPSAAAPPPPQPQPQWLLAAAPPGFPVPSTASAPAPRHVWEELPLLPLADVLRVLTPLAAGLQALHALGYVHNDVKPENVLLRDNGSACLADFGMAAQLQQQHQQQQQQHGVAAAKQTTAAVGAKPARNGPARNGPACCTGGFYHLEHAAGTPGFMAPEVAALGKARHPAAVRLTPAVDVYAFGVTALCVAVTGTRSDVAAWFADKGRRQGAFPAGSFPRYLPFSLEQLLLECVAWRPAARPTAAQLVARLGRIWDEVSACGC
ncbi:hypothetical protein HYH02_006582 [Chlamydomonas schloesseri]|uniref:Protein kinase domain-containing protein n=1 Tax=Chlamydomonas schloesseri TaxID=2026947 RepID=A0A835TJV4_9CHLO|nr:hypothetical protein HYH02_006582 [Chlamydomonas schloesseri]|eukprot:KAG2439055.1 hypothetical protein HYH02_006582 [Chlamydomonas schloesseri]